MPSGVEVLREVLLQVDAFGSEDLAGEVITTSHHPSHTKNQLDVVAHTNVFDRSFPHHREKRHWQTDSKATH